MLTDFNCKIFNSDRLKILSGDERFDSAAFEKINSDLSLLDEMGLHKLFCQVLHDENFSVSRTFEKISELERIIKCSMRNPLGRRFATSVVPAIFLSESAPYIKNISELTVGNSNYIISELPVSITYPDYLDSTINKILYTCRLRPVFTKFDAFASVHRDTDYIEKMINIKGAAFQFSLSSGRFYQSIDLIRKVHARGNTVLFATDCEHDFFNASVISKNIELLRTRLPRSIYIDIMRTARGFLR